MNKVLILIFIIQLYSCPQKEEIMSYALKNSTNFNSIEAILFDDTEKNKIAIINKNDFKIMHESFPYYTPLKGFDSLKIIFEDSKVLTYIPLRSRYECVDSIKNPFCSDYNYDYINNVWTFEIDSTEYKKAR